MKIMRSCRVVHVAQIDKSCRRLLAGCTHHNVRQHQHSSRRASAPAVGATWPPAITKHVRSSSRDACPRIRPSSQAKMAVLILSFLALLHPVSSIHHMKRAVTARQSGGSVPLITTNNCAATIWPAIVTQAGTGPGSTGFELASGKSKNQTVSSGWQGRVWGRTNCTFGTNGFSAGGGVACDSGDCGGTLSCKATVCHV